MRSVSLYVDGFNFYYSIRNHFKVTEAARGYSLSGLSWCDFRALIERNGWLRSGEQLDSIKYFTAPVTDEIDNPSRPGEPGRQRAWLDAIARIPGLQAIEGYHRRKSGERNREEKQTDVNLAIELFLDGVRRQYDRAIVLSGDTDEIPAILAVSARLSMPIEVTVLLPVGQDREAYIVRLQEMKARLRERGEFHPEHHAPVSVVQICEGTLANSLMPYETSRCPPYWRLPAHYLKSHCAAPFRPDAAVSMARHPSGS